MRKITQTIVGTTPPLDKNVLWLDTTNSNEPVQKLFLNGEWKPLKDSDVDAEFSTGEKVSDISIENSSTTTNDIKLSTVANKDSITPKLVGENVTATIDIIENTNKNLTIDTFRERNVDVIDLSKPNVKSDYVTTIRFISSSNPTTITYDDTELLWANEELPICEAGAEYLIAIWKNIGVMTKVAPIPLV